ncbi:uncharacterized protein LOC118191348 [Stegodyphus dumicola]|uniref:uncharacterized protein LOC118191348 n=1 Tax=Stegodyphus dumicola TaxID=202533 RepID=UPI0015AEB96A|nr:uncharacterized protein LOC118191348 [Stegodyphus dumicola]
MLTYFVLAIFVCLSTSDAQDKEVTIPKDKEQCLNQMIQWCNNMKYPQDGAGMTMLAITFEDPSGYYRVFCASDSDGTNCTKNGSPWFACSPDNQFLYQGKVFTESSTDVDDGICSTADKAFNDLFVQNLSFDNTTLKTEIQKGLETFFEQIDEMREQIKALQEQMSKNPFLTSDFWNVFGSGFPFGRPDTTNSPIVSDQSSTQDKNELEKE